MFGHWSSRKVDIQLMCRVDCTIISCCLLHRRSVLRTGSIQVRHCNQRPLHTLHLFNINLRDCSTGDSWINISLC